MTKTEKILIKYKEDPKFNRKEFAKEIGAHRTYISDVINQAKKAGGDDLIEFCANKSLDKKKSDDQMATVTESMNNLMIETKGRSIRTADGAMEYCGVDEKKWNIAKKIINFWDLGKNRNWQVKLFLERKDDLDASEVMERLLKRIPKFKYRAYKPHSVQKSHSSGNLGLIANFDCHIGKLAWHVETGQGDYDIPVAVEEFNHVTDVNLERISLFDPEKIIFILGQDMLHYENLEGVTPKGRNILDTDGRLAKLQDAAIDVCIRNIIKCRAVAPVEVILVQGNHDETSSLWLSKVLRAWFKDDKYVTVDCEPRLRKARLWGDTFIGLAHKVPAGKIAACHAEFSTSKDTKEMWGKAEYREILFGDQHKKMQWKMGSQITHGACLFRQLTALSKIDYWHYSNFFTDAVPGGQAFVYNKRTGCVAEFTEWSFHLTNKGEGKK
jgi:hypothetical protein